MKRRNEKKVSLSLSHLSSTCGGRPCVPDSALRRPEGAGRPAIGRKAETGGGAPAEADEEEKTEEAEGARGSRSDGAPVALAFTTTETRPALAARRRKAAPERAASLFAFSLRASRGGGGGAGREAAASGAGGGGDIFFLFSGNKKKGRAKEKRKKMIEQKRHVFCFGAFTTLSL